MNESINLCLSCGLCCDGTLIGFVQLDNDEIPEIRQLMDIEEVDEKGLFFHPCKCFGPDGCGIYAQRPKNCDKFNCGLLKSFNKKDLSYNVALEVINEVKQRQLAITKLLATLPTALQSKSFYFQILEVKNWLQNDKSENSTSQNHMKLISEIEELDTLVSKNFGISF